MILKVLTLVAIGIKMAEANCRPITGTGIVFGDIFLDNPTILRESGVLTSENFPNNYNPNEQCNFVIRGQAGSRIRIVFSDYQIGNQAAFSLIDGKPTPFGGRFTNLPVGTTTIPAEFNSETSEVGINFSTGADVMRGWRFEFFIEGGEERNNLIEIDSGTSTFAMAILSVIGVFSSLIIDIFF